MQMPICITVKVIVNMDTHIYTHVSHLGANAPSPSDDRQTFSPFDYSTTAPRGVSNNMGAIPPATIMLPNEKIMPACVADGRILTGSRSCNSNIVAFVVVVADCSSSAV